MKRYVVPVLVIALLLALAPLAVAADGTATLTVSKEQAILQYVVYEGAVSYAANSSHSIDISIPEWLEGYVDVIRVIIYSASASSTLTAIDANGSVLLTADIVPLSTAYGITVPPETAQIQLGGSEAWEGTIKIVVESSIEFEVTPPSQITVSGGKGEAPAHIKQVSGPPGEIYLIELDPNFDIAFKDTTPEYSGDTHVETTGAGWEADVPIVVTTAAQPGTYYVEVSMYFKAMEEASPVEVAKLSFTVDLSSSEEGGEEGGGEWSWEDIKSDPTKLALIGLGAIVVIGLMMVVAGGGRKGMASLGSEAVIVLLMLLVAVIGVAITMLDKTMALALGVGVGAFMILLVFLAAGKLRVRG